MKKQLLFFLVFLFTVSAYAQLGGWEWQNPKPQGNDLHDVQFLSDQVGWAVGGGGTVLKSVDGGASWVINRRVGSDYLMALHFIDAEKGWAVDFYGAVIRTVDGGTTWTRSITGSYQTLQSLFFTSAENGIVVGDSGTIMKTSDGGSTWSPVSSGTQKLLQKVQFINSVTGWILTEKGSILKTSDGGSTWVPYSTGTSRELRSFDFIDAQTGWISGDSTVLKTTDGGLSWSAQNITTTGHHPIFEINFRDANNGLALAGYGTLYSTHNGGETWNQQYLETHVTPIALAHFDSQKWITVGVRGVIFKSEDDGTTWMDISTGTPDYYLTQVHFSDAQNGWAMGGIDAFTVVNGNAAFMKTADGGNTWTKSTLPIDFVRKSYSVNEQTFWIADAYGSIIKTSDGGNSWSTPSNNAGVLLSDICFVDSVKILGVFESGIKRSFDGGQNWYNASTGPSFPYQLRAIDFGNPTLGLAVGDNGRILKTINGGLLWSAKPSGTTNELYSVFFLNTNLAWAAGHDVILKSTDGGSTWATQTTTGGNWITSLYFLDSLNGWAMSYSYILATTDGGVTWTEQVSPKQGYLNSVFFTDAENGWIVGAGGTILHTSTGGELTGNKTLVSEPSQFLLYPNPASGSFKIQGPEAVVSASFIDCLGRETSATINSENRIDIQHLIPGLYWVKIRTQKGTRLHKLVKE